ncbi:MAG TPA: DNA replication and repair protein RecF [Thermoanaerobaculia bacterium]|nr:DNA replication and repair protein RecF [Thermoanaerobaculia bacterium]
MVNTALSLESVFTLGTTHNYFSQRRLLPAAGPDNTLPMILESFRIENFRNLISGELHCHPSANIFVGENGQGKTNLLEAIYFLATTKSFRTPRLSNLARIGSETLFVEGVLLQETVRKTFSAGLAGGDQRRRELQVNGQRASLQTYLQMLPVLAYSASRLEIVKGSPEEGRRFLDRGVAGIRHGYLEELSRYGRVLKQRNALLQKVAEGSARAGQLDAWDEEFVSAAEPLVKARAEYTDSLFLEYRQIVEAHRYHVDDLLIRYLPNGFDFRARDRKENLLAFRGRRDREIRSGFTLIGPHRDSVEFSRSDRAAADLLSSGELKMTVLFLKFAKMALQKRFAEGAPVFLLDDIDAELDLGIIQRLLGYLAGSTQIFVTTAKESVIAALQMPEHAMFTVQGGIAKRRD